jgi:hypothetical protein
VVSQASGEDSICDRSEVTTVSRKEFFGCAATYDIPSSDRAFDRFSFPKPGRSTTFKTSTRLDAAEQKIWTNDDIPLLRQLAPILIIGERLSVQANVAGAPSIEAAAANQPYVKELDLRWYAEQRQALQAQIDADEEQIREVQAIRQSGDGITDAIPLDKEVPGLSPEATVDILQKQVAQLEAQIDDLQDLARRNGIDPAVVR